MHDAGHLFPGDFERDAGVDRGCRSQPQAGNGSQALLANEVAGGDKRDGCFLAILRDDGELCATPLKIEDGVGGISLTEEGVFRLQLNNFAAKPCLCQKVG